MITKNPFPPALFPIPRYKKKGKLVILLMEYSRGVFKLFFIKTLGPSFPRLFQLGLFLSTEVKQYLTGRLLRADYCGELKGKSWHLCASLIFEGRKALPLDQMPTCQNWISCFLGFSLNVKQTFQEAPGS